MSNNRSSNDELTIRLTYLRSKANNPTLRHIADVTNHSVATIHSAFNSRRVSWPIVRDILKFFNVEDEETIKDYMKLWGKTFPTERRQPYHELSERLDKVETKLDEIRALLLPPK